MKKLFFFIVLIFLPSFILGIHNASLYNPRHGFDGDAHVYYIKYLYQNKSLPTPGWEISGIYGETHQPPLYYSIGALLLSLTHNIKSVQYVNIFVLWLIIFIVGLGLLRIFKNKNQVLIGMFSLAALPMLNIFPAMISNELLNTLWIVSVAVSMLYIVTAKNDRKLSLYLLWFTASFILGVWTKVSIFLIIPTVLITFLLTFFNTHINRKKFVMKLLLSFVFIIILSAPIILRSQARPNASNIGNIVASRTFKFRPLAFYTRLDWIYNVDMYNTQYYSLLGGAWNSFFTDGHNAITPFVKFHKKSFVLWSLGFLLLPICLYGLIRVNKKNLKKFFLVVYTIGITMLATYFYINIGNGHYSGLRLTYEMGIVVPYAFGIASAFGNKRLKIPIFLILSVQFITLVSFYWILPWWHVTR